MDHVFDAPAEAGQVSGAASDRDTASAAIVAPPGIAIRTVDPSVGELRRRLAHIQLADYIAYKRKQLRTSITLFLLTLLSTFLVGADFVPLHYLMTLFSRQYELFQGMVYYPRKFAEVVDESVVRGLMYAVPLMAILFFHEMGHFLQSRWNRIPASLPYFIPLPLPPLGTMGAVIFQGRGAATRRQMFDIAVCGPIAGLILTLPILWYGLSMSSWQPRPSRPMLEFGEPLLVQWMISFMHGPGKTGEEFMLTPIAFAGWVGVLITAMNLLPVGQLDGGHILYTLIGKRAHIVAMLIIAAGFIVMYKFEDYSFSLLLLLLLITGPRHPPTANDQEPLGLRRHVIGWLTLSFLIIGFTPQPIIISHSKEDGGRSPQERIRPNEDVARLPQHGTLDLSENLMLVDVLLLAVNVETFVAVPH